MTLGTWTASGCGSDFREFPVSEEFNSSAFLRLVGSSAYCVETDGEEVQLFRDQQSWGTFFEAHSRCEPQEPPIFDFDTFALVLVTHEPVPGCGGILPLIEGIGGQEDRVRIHHRRALPEELGTCPDEVQPRDIALIARELAEGRELDVEPPDEGLSICEFF